MTVDYVDDRALRALDFVDDRELNALPQVHGSFFTRPHLHVGCCFC